MTPKLKTFLERGFSTIVLLSILGGALWLNSSIGYGILICLLCNLTTWEWFNMLKGSSTNRWLVLIGGLVYPWLYFLLGQTDNQPDNFHTTFNFPMLALIVYSIVAFLCELGCMDYRGKTAENALSSAARSIMAFIYPVWMFAFSLIFISVHSYDGEAVQEFINFLLCLILFTKMSDIWAYVSGVLLGGKFIKRRFSPVVSPKKTWEGIIGSVILTLVCGALLLRYVMDLPFDEVRDVVIYICCAIPLFALAVAGDLAGSLIKRGLSVKDSGSLLPGIGGIFDLIDSPAFTVSISVVVMGLITIFIS